MKRAPMHGRSTPIVIGWAAGVQGLDKTSQVIGTMFDNDMDRSPRAQGAIEKIEDLVALGMIIAGLFIGIFVFCNYNPM